MSPSFRREINGSRPARVKTEKQSDRIHKPSSSSSSSSSSTSTDNNHDNHHRLVIIHTRSPKIIHAEPGDFMALVQKLTGLPHSIDDDDDDNDETKPRDIPPPNHDERYNVTGSSPVVFDSLEPPISSDTFSPLPSLEAFEPFTPDILEFMRCVGGREVID